jgi:ABC-type transporter Mla subunit MlaD
MTGKWEPGDLRTGILVLGAFAALVAGVIWAGTVKGQDLAPLYAEFPALSGVTTETPVMLNGYKVGHVEDIEPRTDSLGQFTFRVRMSVLWHPGGSARVPYRAGMRVLLIPPAIEMLGTAILRLEPPTVAGGTLPRGATIPSERYVSPLEGAQVRVDSLGGEMAHTLADTRRLLNVLVRTASATTGAATATAGVASVAADQLTALASDTRARLATADSMMRDVRTLTPTARATADSLQALLGDSRRAVARLTRMADANEPQLTRTLASLDTSSALLQHFIKQVSDKPLRVLTGISPMPAPAHPPAPDNRRAIAP